MTIYRRKKMSFWTFISNQGFFEKLLFSLPLWGLCFLGIMEFCVNVNQFIKPVSTFEFVGVNIIMVILILFLLYLFSSSYKRMRERYVDQLDMNAMILTETISRREN